MKAFHWFLVAMSFGLASNGLAQCGALPPKEALLVDESARLVTEYNLNKTLSVNVYILAAAFNVYDIGTGVIEDEWEDLNELFEPIGLSFQICGWHFVPNYNWNVVDREPNTETGMNTEDAILSQFYIPKTINVYYVGDIINPEIAGYAYFPGGPDVIVVRKGAGSGVLAHEMGHFFGLYHTFETSYGLELANGSNCSSTGDLVCDTPADNNGSFNLDECEYTDMATDANGQPYTPYLSNIMAYYGGCGCKFTVGQYNRMAWMYLNQRNYLF